ncbi:MAG TPA: hypothetical protein VFB89_08535 [Gemmatimonadales bacterium]|nr:hypothetical protein [Gemmatimonadales bacterium]
MSELARRLENAERIPCGCCRSCLGIREDAPCFQGDPNWDNLAAEALAYVKEKLSGSGLVKILERPDHLFSPQRKANAILALLDEPTPDPERREG